jgi:hypothetical protein
MAEALKVRSSPFFSPWHEEVFKIWETHHLVPTEDGEGVTLATPSWAEAAVFSESEGLGQGWDALPGLEVPCAFLMAGDAGATLGEDLTREMVWRPPLATNERIMDAGHLVSIVVRRTLMSDRARKAGRGGRRNQSFSQYNRDRWRDHREARAGKALIMQCCTKRPTIRF